MTTFILIRHGETTGNVDGLWHGRLDAPLTPRGRRQVDATARRMAELAQEYGLDAFYVSPLPRAQSTAAAIAAATGFAPQVDEGLTEFDLGDWEGRSFVELREVEDLWNRWQREPDFAPPNGESPVTFAQRVVATMHRLADAHPGQTVLVVTHGGFLSNLLGAWLEGRPGDWRRWDPHNCAISVLRRSAAGDDRWQPILVNDTSHLPEDALNPEAPSYL